MILEKPAGRGVYRASEDIKTARSTYKVPFEMLVPGWNPRVVFEGIEELAKDIAANGMHEPIRGDLAPDGLKFIMMDGGGRRYRALQYLRDNDICPIDEVEVMPLLPMGTADKILFILSTGVNKEAFKPMEVAAGIAKLKEETAWTNAEIAEKMGRSRQWVDNMLKILSLPDDVKDGINDGTVKPTNALQNRGKKNREEIIAGTNAAREFMDEPKEGEDGFIPEVINHPSIADMNASRLNPDDLHIPENTDPKDEMNGIIAPAKGPWREAELDVKALEKEVDNEEIQLRNPEVKKIIKNVRNLCSKLEGAHRGLPEQSQADADKYLLWIRNDMNELEMILKTNLKR